MRQYSHRDRDAIDLRNASRKRKQQEENTIWFSILRRARKLETWIVGILILVVIISVVCPVLNKVSETFGIVATAAGKQASAP